MHSTPPSRYEWWWTPNRSPTVPSPPSRDILITSITTATYLAVPVLVYLVCCHDGRPRLTLPTEGHLSCKVLNMYMVNSSYLFYLNITVISRCVENLIIDIFNYLYIDKMKLSINLNYT